MEKLKNGRQRIHEWVKGLSPLAHRAGLLLRSGWKRYGYYCALAALLCMLGIASVRYRSQKTGSGQTVPDQAEPQPVAQMAEALTQPQETIAPQGMMMPALGEVIGEYSPDMLTWSETMGQWQTHCGVDIACGTGEAVYAAADGTVTDVYEDALYGGVIEIDHGGERVVRYASLENIRMVQAGDAVKRGEVIASAGNSAACETALGSHVHVEMYENGFPADFLQYVD